jgi:hypothetical protein
MTRQQRQSPLRNHTHTGGNIMAFAITAQTTNNELVKEARAGNKAAFAELEARAKRNGPNSRAAHAVEALTTGKGFASYGEFFAALKQAQAKPSAPVKASSKAKAGAKAKAAPAKSKAISAWAFVAPNGKNLDANKLADDVATVASVAVKSAIINALTK